MRRVATEVGTDTRFIEIGPGKVLSGLLRLVVGDAHSTNLGSAADVRQFLEETG